MNFTKNQILTGVAIIAILITGFLIYSNQNPGKFILPGLGLSDKALAEKGIDYLNKNVLSGQSQATLENLSRESGLVKMKIKIDSSKYDTYITRDGRLLFPQAFNLEPKKDEKTGQDNKSAPSAQSCEALPKSDKPMLEAYIVSRCPFGLQMQRMMAEAIKNSPDLANYVKVMYIGSVSGNKISAMHGDAEAAENLRQICIREEQPTKYWNYISCQMKAKGAESSCQISTGVDSAKLNACISDASRGVAYAQKDFDSANKYGAQGSPTLIMGGSEISEFSADGKAIFGGRSADEIRSIVCCAAGDKLGFCSKRLTTTEAATGFSAAYPTSNASGSSSSAGCEPAQ